MTGFVSVRTLLKLALNKMVRSCRLSRQERATVPLTSLWLIDLYVVDHSPGEAGLTADAIQKTAVHDRALP